MVNTISSARDLNESGVKSFSFGAYRDELQQFLRVEDSSKMDNLIADLDFAGLSLADDDQSINNMAALNSIDPQRLRTALQRIRNNNVGEKPELSSSVVTPEGKLQTQVPETPEQAVARLTAELKRKDNQLRTIEPAVIGVELATNPTKIPRLLRQKFRNRMISRKQRDPYELLYYLRDGQMRRFKRTKKRMENIDRVYQDLRIKYGPDAQANEKLISQKRMMEKRWAVIEEAYKAVQNIRPKKVTL